jgi:hypothetical protein
LAALSWAENISSRLCNGSSFGDALNVGKIKPGHFVIVLLRINNFLKSMAKPKVKETKGEKREKK